MSTGIRQWLDNIGLAQYAKAFEGNDIDVELLAEVSDTVLRDIGITSAGHRLRILRAINGPSALSKGNSDRALAAEAQIDQQRTHAPQAERRQLTVMFCDLVGSTALSERLDPEELRDLMQAYQRVSGEVIARYEGHVAQYLGDGLMVYFGWPRAHEDDAVRAIRAGLEVVKAISELKAAVPLSARIGIHTGLVVVGETGEGDASIPKAAVGETPNIAARLQSLAEPSSVVVSERTRSLASGLFDYADLGPHTLKGVSEPVRLSRVVGTRATGSRFDASRSEAALTPLVGREEEVALLMRRWQQAKEGEGQVVLVGGEPGIGKSRLTRVLRERLGQEPHKVLRYQCSPFHINSALYPAIEQFERAAGFTREDSAEQKLDKLEGVLAGSAQRVSESAPLFAALLCLPTERYPPLNLTPQKQKEKTLEALAGRVEALAQQQPLLMIYEDVHWMDATSQEAMDLLVPRLRNLPVLMIVTHRPEYSPRWTDQAHVTTLGLNRLGRRQGMDFVVKLTAGKALPQEVLDQILAHTDGVPLFIEELTKSVLESKLVRETNDGYLLDAPLHALAIPMTLRESLLARLDRLAPVRELAQIGACIGREFSYELLAAVAPSKGQQLTEALDQLSKSGLVFRRGTPPDAMYTFKHALVQDAAYDSLLKSKRSQLHSQIAQALEKDFLEQAVNEPEVLAHHLTQAGLNARAVPYWIQAGQRALSRVALPEAVGHLTKALSINEGAAAEHDRDQRELDIRLLLATAFMTSLGWAAVEIPRTLEPARELAIRLGSADKLFQILDYFHTYYFNRCELARVQQINQEIAALARSRNDSAATVIARFDEAITQQCMGNFRQAHLAYERVLKAYDSERHRELVQIYNYEPKCLTLAADGYMRWAAGYPDQARQAVLDALSLARRLAHAFNLCWILTSGTLALVLRGETRLAREWIIDAHALAQEHAMKYILQVAVPTWDGTALIEQGDYAEGYAKLTEGETAWRNAGGVLWVPGWNARRALALIALKRFREARYLLDEAVELIETGHRPDESEVHRVLGKLLQRQPTADLDAAERCFLKSREVARAHGAKGLELRAAISLAQLWQGQGKHHEAYHLVAPIYDWFTEGFDTRDLREAKALLEELSRQVAEL